MSKTLLIMAAGTGGHVMPGLAIAKAMQARGWKVHWLGTSHGMENWLVPPSGLPMTQLKFSGLRGKGWKHTVLGAFRLLGSTRKAWRLLRKLKPQAVLGMGGYVTVPGGWAAKAAGVPLAVVNADAALLISNRALVKHAKRVLFGFDGGAATLGDMAFKARVTGNPVRAEIVHIAPPEQRFAGRQGPLRVLVLGGSLGAQVLNATLPEALAALPAAQRPVVIHQSGAQHTDALSSAYKEAGVEARVAPFIDDIAAAYTEADVLVCRAGAITVSELAVAGVASILVPLVLSTTSHQHDNARWMVEHGAAIHLSQQEMTPQRLATLLKELTRTRLLAMAHAARELGRPKATETIANELESIALPLQGGKRP